MTKRTFTTLFLSVLLSASFTTSAKNPPRGATSLTEANTREEKHFDRNEDGFLDPYERLNFRTYTIFHYTLVTKKKQQPYDANKDLMLEPFELKQYEADKASGRLTDVYLKYKKDEEKRKERLKQSYQGPAGS